MMQLPEQIGAYDNSGDYWTKWQNYAYLLRQYAQAHAGYGKPEDNYLPGEYIGYRDGLLLHFGLVDYSEIMLGVQPMLTTEEEASHGQEV